MRRDATHPLVQFIKYGMAGGVATFVDIVVFYTLALWFLPALGANDPLVTKLHLNVTLVAETVRSTNYVWDKCITFLFSNLTAYVVNVLWVFTPGRHSRWVEVGLFYLVSAISFVVGTGLAWLLIKQFGISTTAAYICNAVASLMINYVCRKFIIFKG